MGDVSKTYKIGPLTFVDKNGDGIYQSDVDSILDSKGDLIPSSTFEANAEVINFKNKYCLPESAGLDGLKINALLDPDYLNICPLLPDKLINKLLYTDFSLGISEHRKKGDEIKLKILPFISCPCTHGLIHESFVSPNLSSEHFETTDFDQLIGK